ALGLNEDFAGVRHGVGAFEGFVAVDRNADFVAIAENFHLVPFAAGLLDFVRAAKAFHVLPWAAARPVEPRDGRAFRDAVHGQKSAADDQDVARPAFDDLRLDRFGPDLVFTDAMDEDAAVTGIS